MFVANVYTTINPRLVTHVIFTALVATHMLLIVANVMAFIPLSTSTHKDTLGTVVRLAIYALILVFKRDFLLARYTMPVARVFPATPLTVRAVWAKVALILALNARPQIFA